ncbi:MAG: PAS domain S-box protein [Candidatus Omnitrophota bacterium]
MDKPGVEALLKYANSIIATLREPFLVLDKNLKIISANQAFYINFKTVEKETIGRPLPDLGDKQWDIPKLLLLLKDILPEKKVVKDYEVEHKFEQIGERIMCLNACQVRVSKKIAGVIEEELILLAIEDITERRRLEIELKESEERYRRAFETSRDGLLLVHKTKGDILNSNESIQGLLGYSHEELLKKKLWEIGVVKNDKDFQETLSRLEKDGVIHYEDTPVKTKKNLSINTEAFLVNRAKVMQCNIRNITERKRIENELMQAKEQQYRTLIENLPGKVFLKDSNSVFISCNENYAKDLKIRPEEIAGKTDYDFFPTYLAEKYRADDKRVMESGKTENIEEEYVVIGDYLGNSKTVFINTVKVPVRNKTGDVTGVFGLFWDITERKRAEEQSRLNERKIRALFDQAFQFIGMMTVDGTLIEANRTAMQFAGINESDCLGKPFWDTPWWAHSKTMQDKLRAAVTKAASGETVFFEATHPAADGSIHCIDFSLKPIKDQDGKTVFLIPEGRDITERKKVEAEREIALKWQEDVNAIQQSLLAPATLEDKLKSITGNIVRIFDADFCRIWLIRPGDLCDKGCIHAEAKEGPHVCRFRDKCLHLMASSGRYTHIDGKSHARVPFGCYKIGRIASGEHHKFLTNDVLNDPGVHNHEWARELGLKSFAGYQLKVPGGETIGVLALFARHAIMSDEDAVLDNLSVTTAFVIQQAAAAEEVIQAQAVKTSSEIKSNFAGMVSHELRTPLAAIKEGVSLILDKILGDINAEQQKYLGITKKNVDRLDRLINGVLDFQTLESGKMKFKMGENDINEVVKEIRQTMLPVVEKKNLDFMCKLDKDLPRVTFDRDKIIQVLTNLVNNALKFTDKGSITITTDRRDNCIQVTVNDTGPGIKKEDIPKLFQQFTQLQRKVGGAGLGLSICKQIIEAHKGKIWAESEFGKGAVFHFILPIKERRA